MRIARREATVLVRFAGVGVVNTGIDLVLFLLLHDRLGITAANFVSSTAGMTFSFVVNGLFTFRAERLTVRSALLFVATTGTVLWGLQPLVIHGLLLLAHHLGAGDGGAVFVVAKLGAVATALVVNFAAYRYVVWPARVELGLVDPSEETSAPV